MTKAKKTKLELYFNNSEYHAAIIALADAIARHHPAHADALLCDRVWVSTDLLTALSDRHPQFDRAREYFYRVRTDGFLMIEDSGAEEVKAAWREWRDAHPDVELPEGWSAADLAA